MIDPPSSDIHWAAIVGAVGAVAIGLALLVSVFTLREQRHEFRVQQSGETLTTIADTAGTCLPGTASHRPGGPV